MLRHLEHGPDPLDRHLHLIGDLLRGRFAAEVLDQLLLHAHQLVDRFDHVHRDADRARLICDGSSDGLADPPRGVGRELVAPSVLELLDRLHEAHVALLNEIEEREASVRVLLGNGDHQAEVGFDHLGLGLQRLPLEVLQLTEGSGVFVQRHADEFLQCFDLSLLGINNSQGLSGALLGLELLDGTDGRLELLVNVLRHQRHFLDDLLLVVELRE